jgi:hypothetical protein
MKSNPKPNPEYEEFEVALFMRQPRPHPARQHTSRKAASDAVTTQVIAVSASVYAGAREVGERGCVHSSIRNTHSRRCDHSACLTALSESRGYPASSHAWNPPASGRTREKPSFLNCSATRALEASPGQVQYRIRSRSPGSSATRQAISSGLILSAPGRTRGS